MLAGLVTPGPMFIGIRSVLVFTVLLAVSPLCSAQSQDFVVTLGGGVANPGEMITLPQTINSVGTDGLQGFTFSMLAGADSLIPLGVQQGAALSTLNGGSGPAFFDVELFFDPGLTGMTVGVIFDFMAVEELPAGSVYHTLDLLWQLAPTAVGGTVTEVGFCDCLGSPPLSSIVISLGQSITPVLIAGEVTILGGIDFVRGDANADGVIDISDPVSSVLQLFGLSPLLCLDAIDSDANGTLTLADVFFTLNYLIALGPAPSAPFPNCGSVPGIGCSSFVICP